MKQPEVAPTVRLPPLATAAPAENMQPGGLQSFQSMDKTGIRLNELAGRPPVILPRRCVQDGARLMDDQPRDDVGLAQAQHEAATVLVLWCP